MAEDSRKHLPGEFNMPEKGIPKEEADKMREMDTAIAKTFNSTAGKKVLEWLRGEYVDTAIMGYAIDRNGAFNADVTTFQLYQREGQRIVVKNIEMRIKRANANSVKPPKPKTDN